MSVYLIEIDDVVTPEKIEEKLWALDGDVKVRRERRTGTLADYDWYRGYSEEMGAG